MSGYECATLPSRNPRQFSQLRSALPQGNKSGQTWVFIITRISGWISSGGQIELRRVLWKVHDNFRIEMEKRRSFNCVV